VPLTKAERSAVLKKALTHLKKMEADSAYVPLDPKVRQDNIPVISTGSVVLDKVLGCNGLPKGRIIEVFGPEAVGKSTFAIHCCIEAQALGGFATYIDFEHAVHLGYAQKIGLDLSEDNFAFFQPDYFEQGAQVAYTYAKLVQSDIIVIDSVTAMIPKKVYEAGPEDPAKGTGLQARLMSSFLNLISKVVSETGTILLFVNQMRSNIKFSQYDPGPEFITSGGKALPYYASVRLQLKPGKVEKANVMNNITGEREELPISNFVKATGVKNKVGFPKRSGEFIIRYGEGIDNVRSIMQVAERHKILKKEGSWYSYGKEGAGGFRKQGIEQTRKYLIENIDVFKLIAAEVHEKLASFDVATIGADISDDDIRVEDRSGDNSGDAYARIGDDETPPSDDEDIEAILKSEDTPEPVNTSKKGGAGKKGKASEASTLGDDDIMSVLGGGE
jgi:recombination protein RecA